MRRQDDSFPRSNPSYLSHSLPLCKTLFVGILMICLLLPVSYLMFTAGFKIGEGISILFPSIKSSISALEEDASESILIPKEPLNLRMSSLKDPPLPSCPVYKGDRDTEIYDFQVSGPERNEKSTFFNPPFLSGDPPICRLSTSSRSPIPVILVSSGRSGSSSTWQVMSRLTGHCFRGQEYTGSGSVYTRQFFKRIGEKSNGNWMLGYLCMQQRKFEKKGGIVGFKWKPFNSSLSIESSLDGFRMLGQQINPQVKIVRLKRNVLDVEMSKVKHRLDRKLSPHCDKDDVDCIEQRKQGFHLPVSNLLEELKFLSDTEDLYDDLLKKNNINHIQITYEALFYDDNAEEWMKIFHFIGRGPGIGLTRKRVEDAMEHAGTTSRSHKESLSNYETVQKLLKGTEFEKLLH